MSRVLSIVGVSLSICTLASIFLPSSVLAEEQRKGEKELVAAPKIQVKESAENVVILEFVSNSADLIGMRWIDVETKSSSRMFVREGGKFAERYLYVSGSLRRKTVRDERLQIDREIDFVRIRDLVNGREYELQEQLPLKITHQAATLVAGDEAESELVVEVGAYFNLAQDGVLRPPGVEGIEGGSWYKLMEIRGDEVILSPTNEKGVVAEGAKRLELESLSRKLRLSEEDRNPKGPLEGNE